MIQFDNVTRAYGSKLAVAGLNLDIPGGELFALLGPNGAGKTTSIKMLVGLLRPTSGTVRVCGYDVVRENQHASRLLGYVPDVPYLYDKLTGREFLEFIADMYGLDPEQSIRQLVRAISDFELTDFVDELTETYSHGMRQRLTFAAALLHQPTVLVIDEPMVGLDPRSARVVKDLLQTKAREGMTIFMSTHLLSVAEEIAHRVAIVDHGRLRFLGTVDQLRGELAVTHTSLEHLYLSLTATPGEILEGPGPVNPADASEPQSPARFGNP
ncbi:MAG TPA: ABC transporter ATP-binding protein [Pirellulales bacterium]|nr:ABC transporter ATP-binding protein [Pirellulales bacterium]